MGSICNPKEPKYIEEGKQHERDILRIDDISQLKSIRFQFTTQLLIHVKADLLILFMDHTTNMRRNDHFYKLPVQGAKIEEHANAELVRKGDSNAMPQAPFVSFNIIIPTLNFNKVSIIFCNIWRKDQHNDTQLSNLLRDYFESLEKFTFKSIAIAQFSSELGVNLQKGVKRVMRQIVKMPNKPEVIEFVCLTESSKAIYMEAVNNHSQDVKRFFQSPASSQKSNYY